MACSTSAAEKKVLSSLDLSGIRYRVVRRGFTVFNMRITDDVRLEMKITEKN